MKVSNPKKSHLYLLIIVWLTVHAALFLVFGIRDQFVDSRRYIAMADHLITYGSLEYARNIFYFIPVLLLAVFRLVFPDGAVAYVLFQSLFSGLATLALYRASATLFGDGRAGFFSALIFMLWIECIQWNTAVMTESVAASFICIVIYTMTHLRDTARSQLFLATSMILCILTRPTGVIIWIGVVSFFWMRYQDLFRDKPFLKVGAALALGLSVLMVAYLMLDQWDFTDQYQRGNIVSFMDILEGKDHYHSTLRLDTAELVLPPPDNSPVKKIAYFIISNPLHFLKAAVLKIFYLVCGVRPYYSLIHNIYTAIWLSSVYFLFYLGTRAVKDQAVAGFALTVVVANCLLVGMSAIDWDNRFFLPMQPGIALLAGGGAASLARRVSSRLPLRRTSN